MIALLIIKQAQLEVPHSGYYKDVMELGGGGHRTFQFGTSGQRLKMGGHRTF